VSMTDAMAHFLEVPAEVLEAIFRTLSDEGVIEPTPDADTYKVLVQAMESQPSVGAPQADCTMDHVTGKLTDLSVSAGKELALFISTQSCWDKVNVSSTQLCHRECCKYHVASLRNASSSYCRKCIQPDG
jgi:hypothetical protein